MYIHLNYAELAYERGYSMYIIASSWKRALTKFSLRWSENSIHFHIQPVKKDESSFYFKKIIPPEEVHKAVSQNAICIPVRTFSCNTVCTSCKEKNAINLSFIMLWVEQIRG